MAKTKKTITHIDVARKEAAEMIAAGTLPTIRELAERWGCSAFRVSYVLKQVRTNMSAPAPKRGRPKNVDSAAPPARRLGRPRKVAAAPQVKHPVLSRIGDALIAAENDLLNAEGYISAVPGLASAEVKLLVKKVQAGIWSQFHTVLTGELESVQKLSTGRRKRRTKKKAV